VVVWVGYSLEANYDVRAVGVRAASFVMGDGDIPWPVYVLT